MQQYPRLHTRTVLGVTLACSLALAACAGNPPREQMAVAKATVDRATSTPDAAASAPVELQSARDKLARAEKAMANKDYDEARQLAEQAQADARLAEAKAQAARSGQALKEVQGTTVRTLNDELQRSGAAR